MTWRLRHLPVLLIMAFEPSFGVAQQSIARKVVKTRDDLPRFTYPISGTATDLIRADDATFARFAAKVNADIDTVLTHYDVQDKATSSALYGQRAGLQILSGDSRGLIRTIETLRGLTDKPEAKLLTSITAMALARARLSTNRTTGPAYVTAFNREFTASLNKLPWAVVRNGIKQRRGAALIASSDTMLGHIQATVEPGVARTHQLSSENVNAVIVARGFIRYFAQTGPQELAALTAYITAHDTPKPDIWAARDVTLTAADHLTPVRVGIWDTGVDLSLFPDQTFVDPTPGSSADPHGLAYDIDFRPSRGDLNPLTPTEQDDYAVSLGDIKGSADLDASIESPEADAWRRKLAGLDPVARASLAETTYFFGGHYIHGTHVAGIAARGNPAIRLAIARSTWEWHNVPAPITDDFVTREIDAYQHYVDWFRTRGIRVVNMSWGLSPSDFEDNLEANGIGKDAADRKVIARRLFERDRDGLRRALASAPDVLFVCASGNSNDDNGFTEDEPSSFDLPNLVAVGAVDQAGEEVSFTTYGKSVQLHASGYQVESVVPGGARLRLSGTSMAAPAVVNLAAKLLAIGPSLTPTEVIQLIVAGSQSSADGRLHIINPKASIAMIRQRQRTDIGPRSDRSE